MKVPDNVDDCPESIVEGEAVGVLTVGRELTVTVTALEVLVTGDPALSVTCSSNDQVPVVLRAPVDIEVGEVQDEELPRLLKLPAPGAFCSQWHVYGETPPVKVAESDEDCPASIVVGLAVGVATDRVVTWKEAEARTVVLW